MMTLIEEPLTGEIVADTETRPRGNAGGAVLLSIAYDLNHLSATVPQRHFADDEELAIAVASVKAAVDNLFMANEMARVDGDDDGW